MHFYSTFRPDAFRSISDGHVLSPNRYDQIHEYRPLIGDSLLLVAVHLQSKLHLDEKAQGQLGTRLRPRIEEAEGKVGHQRTIIFGDFNMSPFETGMVNSEALHSVMDRRVVEKFSRKVCDEERSFFYNPMWRLMGNSSASAPGTLYYAKSEPVQYFWNTFDQVLIRPGLLGGFDDRNLSIVTQIGRDSLLADSGLGAKKKGSDHLPIVFTLTT